MTPLKLLGLGTVLLSVLSAGTVSHAQDWPNRPVKVVVPFAAAGTTDRLGRIAAEELSKTFKQQFYVENRVGGGGVVGAVQVARADPDGYTLMIGGYGPHIFAPATTANLGYDALSDFTHVAMIGGESFIIVAHPALGVKSFADLVQLAKSRSGPLNMASPGQSTLGALVVEQLIRKPGLLPNLNHVPYRGGGSVMADLLGNHVSLGCIVLSAAIEHIHSGTLVPLALIATERAQALTELPTIVELGHPDIGGAIWSWLAGPKNLPAPMVARLNQELRRSLQAPELKQRFERDLFLSMDADVPTLNRFIAGELKRWTAFYQDSGLKPQ
ncbi:MAG TPA: tripartite tricarboxylate transporter substrate binding protein [Xanthobacteraceae bacterium]|nr:tripartite tricarboxylate transporter substrate binding protein [Xanthobacteraceae bacterium]